METRNKDPDSTVPFTWDWTQPSDLPGDDGPRLADGDAILGSIVSALSGECTPVHPRPWRCSRDDVGGAERANRRPFRLR